MNLAFWNYSLVCLTGNFISITFLYVFILLDLNIPKSKKPQNQKKPQMDKLWNTLHWIHALNDLPVNPKLLRRVNNYFD